MYMEDCSCYGPLEFIGAGVIYINIGQYKANLRQEILLEGNSYLLSGKIAAPNFYLLCVYLEFYFLICCL